MRSGVHGGENVIVDCTSSTPSSSVTNSSICSDTCGPIGQPGLVSVKVTCTVTASGTFVGIQGLITTRTTPLLVFVTASTGLLQVGLETRTAGSFYNGKTAGIVTLVSGGGHMTGDVTETVKAGGTPHMLHVTGDATWGTTVTQ